MNFKNKIMFPAEFSGQLHFLTQEVPDRWEKETEILGGEYRRLSWCVALALQRKVWLGWGVVNVKSVSESYCFCLGGHVAGLNPSLNQKVWFPGHLYKHWPLSKPLFNHEQADWSPTLLRCVPGSLFILENLMLSKASMIPYTHSSLQ